MTKKILFICPTSSPFDVRYGGAQRSNLLLHSCVRTGVVDVICFENLPDDIREDGFHILYARRIENKIRCSSRLGKFFQFFSAWRLETQWNVNEECEKIIDQIIHKKHYDYIVTRYINEAVSMGLLKYKDRLVIDIDDNPVEKALNEAKLAKTLRNKIYMTCFASLTNIGLRRLLKQTAVAFFSNKKQAIDYQSFYLPNIPFYEPDINNVDRKFIRHGRILFVGDLTYAPNYMGLEHFLTSIYPNIGREIEMHIVGRITDDEMRNRWNDIPNVSVLGFVDDLLHEYAEAEIIVIPIYFGAGTCIKVLEAMQMQRVLVTTPIGVRGYEDYISPDSDFLLANNDKEFAESIQKAYDDMSLQEKLTSNAKDKINKHFSKETFFKIVSNALINVS